MVMMKEYPMAKEPAAERVSVEVFIDGIGMILE
jgi:hypothetical protein